MKRVIKIKNRGNIHNQLLWAKSLEAKLRSPIIIGCRVCSNEYDILHGALGEVVQRINQLERKVTNE